MPFCSLAIFCSPNHALPSNTLHPEKHKLPYVEMQTDTGVYGGGGKCELFNNSQTTMPCHVVNRGVTYLSSKSCVSHTLLSRLPARGHVTAKATSRRHDIDREFRTPPNTPKRIHTGFFCGKSRLYCRSHIFTKILS